MEKRTKLITLTLMLFLFQHSVQASVIAIVTESSARADFTDLDVDGNPRFADFFGKQISEGAESRNSAAVFDSTSDVGNDVIFFKNGNASYGAGVTSSSRTVVDISFENTGTTAVTPTLNSQIVPAGLGIYVTNCGPNDFQNVDLRECPLGSGLTFDPNDYTFDDVLVDGQTYQPGEKLVGSMFDFRVMAGNQTLFSLEGELALATDGNGNVSIVQEFDQIEGFLTGFRQTSPINNGQQISFDWGATDFEVTFPDSMRLGVGESGTLTYITEVSTYSNAQCFDKSRISCPIAYGAFGDPIGRGGAGGSRTVDFLSQLLSPSNTDSIDGIDIGLFEFNLPTFENGEIGYRAISGPGINATPNPVSAPVSSALVFAGLVLIGLRRRIC